MMWIMASHTNAATACQRGLQRDDVLVSTHSRFFANQDGLAHGTKDGCGTQNRSGGKLFS
jgi:hypothetical protein